MNLAPSIQIPVNPSRMPLPTYTQQEQHQHALLRMASHHLPTRPPPQPIDCLAFRQLAQRLLAWDRLHGHRPVTEHWLTNYPRECPVGPEVLWAVFPRRVLVRHAPHPSGPAPVRPEPAVVPKPPRRVSTTTEEESAASTRSSFSPPPPHQVIFGPDGHHDGRDRSILASRKDDKFNISNKTSIATDGSILGSHMHNGFDNSNKRPIETNESILGSHKHEESDINNKRTITMDESILGSHQDAESETSNKRPIATLLGCRTAHGGDEDEEQIETTSNKRTKFMPSA